MNGDVIKSGRGELIIFDSWKNGTGFLELTKTLDSKPGTMNE